MKKRLGTAILAATISAVVALPAAMAAGGAGRGAGFGSGSGGRNHSPVRAQERLRLRDGSCIDPAGPKEGAMEKRGFTYGPGNGTGNGEDRPLDGTGYGAPANR